MTELLSVRPPVFPSVERPGPVRPSDLLVGRSVPPSSVQLVGLVRPSVHPVGLSICRPSVPFHRSGPYALLVGRSVCPSGSSVRPSVNQSIKISLIHENQTFIFFVVPTLHMQ